MLPKNYNAKSETSSEIKNILSDIEKTQNFSPSLPFQLTCLKNQLYSSNKNILLTNSIELLKNNVFQIFNTFLKNEFDSSPLYQNIQTKIGEILLEVITSVLNDKTTKETNYIQYIEGKNAISFFESALPNLPISNPETFKLYFYCYDSIILFKKSNNNKNISNFLIKLSEKTKTNSELNNLVLDLIKKLEGDEYKDKDNIIIDQTEVKHIDLNNSTTSSKSSINIKEIEILNAIIKKNSNGNLMENPQLEQIVKSIEKPFEFFINIISKNNCDPCITIYSCKILSLFIEQENINEYIEFIQFVTFDDFKLKVGEKRNKEMIELKEIINEGNFSIVKMNIIRILILMYKDKNFSDKMIENKSVESFVILLKNDLTNLNRINSDNEMKKEDKEGKVKLYKDYISYYFEIIITLIKKFDFGIKCKNNQTYINVISCFDNILLCFPNEKKYIFEIFKFFLEQKGKNGVDLKFIFNYINCDIEKENTLEKAFITLLMMYYDKKEIYSFLHKMSIDVIFPNYMNSTLFNEDINQLEKLIEGKRESTEIDNIVNALSLKLILGNTLKKEENVGFSQMFPKTSFDNYERVVIKLIQTQIVNMTSSHSRDNSICYIIILIFSSIENFLFEKEKRQEKCDLIFQAISHICNEKLFSLTIAKVFSMRIYRLIYYKLTSYTKILFSNEVICTFILNSLPFCALSPNEDKFTKELLIILNNTLSIAEAQMTNFIKGSGISLLMSIIKNNTILNSCIIDLLIKNLHIISNKDFDNTFKYFNENSKLTELLEICKEIKFAKGINESLYYEAYILICNLFRRGLFTDVILSTRFLSFLTQELIDIANFYSEMNNNVLLLFAELMTIFCQEIAILLKLKKEKIFEVNLTLLNKMKNIKNNFNLKLFNLLIQITISFFLKIDHKDQALKEIYSYKSFRMICELIKELIIKEFNKINDFSQICFFIATLFKYEVKNNEGESKLITKEFMNEVKKLLGQKSEELEKLLQNCIEQANIPEKKEDNKKIIVKKTLEEEIKEIAIELEKIIGSIQNIETDVSMRKNVKISSNYILKVKYQRVKEIYKTLYNKLMNWNKGDKDKANDEMNLIGVLKLFNFFIFDGENIKMLIEDKVIDNIIEIIERQNVFSIECQKKALSLFYELSKNEVMIECIKSKKNIIDFCFDNYRRIKDDNIESFFISKLVIITTVLGELSNQSSFVQKYANNINQTMIYDVLYKDSTPKELIVPLMTLLKNIIKFNSDKKTQDELQEDNEELINLIMNIIIEKYTYESKVILGVIEIIKIKTNKDAFIILLSENQIVEKLCKVLIVDTVNELNNNYDIYIDVLCLFNQLSINKEILYMISEVAIFPILSIVSQNIFNAKLVEQSLILFLTCVKAQRNYIEKVSVANMKEFTVQVMAKYMNSNNTNIIKLTTQFILKLLKGSNNIKFYSQNKDCFLMAFQTNIMHKEIISLLFDIIVNITNDDVIRKSQRLSSGLSVIGGYRSSGKQIADDSSLSLHSVNDSSNQVKYDTEGLFDIVNKIFVIYINDHEIISKLYKLIINLMKMTNETWIHKITLDLVLSNASMQIEGGDENNESMLEMLNMFIKTLENILKFDEEILNEAVSSLILIALKKLISKFRITQEISREIITILLYIVTQKDKSILPNLSKEIREVLEVYRAKPDIITVYSVQVLIQLIIEIQNYSEGMAMVIIKENLIFILKVLQREAKEPNLNKICLLKMQALSSYFIVTSKEEACELIEIFTSIIESYKETKKHDEIGELLTNISKLSKINPILTDELRNNSSIIDGIWMYIQEKKVQDTRLEYSLKSYEMCIKANQMEETEIEETQRQSILDTIALEREREYEKAKKFLSNEMQIIYYKDDGNNIKCILKMTNDLGKIQAYLKKKDGLKVIDEMDLNEMDSCVRNCSANAFTKKKRGIFSKKPKGKNCFSILGMKEMNKSIKTFCVECNEEESCIKYVDFLSMIIEKYKKIQK